MIQIKDCPIEAYPYSIHDVHISDPYILADPVSRKYYTYVQFVDSERFPEFAEVKEKCFYVLESEDLIHWSRPSICFRRGSFWADLDYWAPECHYYRGKYYLISSFRAEGTFRRCQCLVADSPKGPFAPIEADPVTPEGWHCLDGTLYEDRKGSPWMVFCHEWLQVNDGQICAVPLSDDLGHAIGDPIILFRASDALWTCKAHQNGGGWVTDGPFLYRLKSGKLIMLWSSFSPLGNYTVGIAESRFGDIEGPWIQHDDPLLMMDAAHSMLFHTFGGQLMMSCHCPNQHEKKRILLFEMEETKDSVRTINEVTNNWYHLAGGISEQWRYRVPCREAHYFTVDPRGTKTAE